jgi:hypothetical protein
MTIWARSAAPEAKGDTLLDAELAALELGAMMNTLSFVAGWALVQSQQRPGIKLVSVHQVCVTFYHPCFKTGPYGRLLPRFEPVLQR